KCAGWNPETGERAIFDSPEDRAAKGWLDHHPLDEDKGGAGEKREAPDKVPPLSREELLQALKEGGVQHKDDATEKQLNSALRGALIKALATAKIEHDPKAPTRELLEKVRGAK